MRTVKLFIAILSWVAMAVACALFSFRLFVYSFVIAIIAAVLRVLPPRPRPRGFLTREAFIVLLPLWGILSAESHGHWSDAANLLSRMVALLALVLVAAWSLHRDWYRFHFPELTYDAD